MKKYNISATVRPISTKFNVITQNVSLECLRLLKISISKCQDDGEPPPWKSTNCNTSYLNIFLPSVLWHRWLGDRKGIRPIKNWAVGCWRGSVWSKVQTCIWTSGFHCHSLSLASVKSRLVLTFWCWLARVVPDKGPLNGCMCVCLCAISHNDADESRKRISRLPSWIF